MLFSDLTMRKHALLTLMGLLLALHSCSCNKAPKQNEQQQQQKRGLCDEFSELRELIPHDTLLEIVGRHYKYDARFRRSIAFLRSPEFTDVAEQIEQTKVYEGILMKFENAGIDTSDIATMSKLSDCLLLAVPIEAALLETDNGDGNDDGHKLSARSLQTFTMEIMNAIPRNEFRELLTRNLSKNPQFARFYNVVRTGTFQQQLMRDLGTPELAQPLAVMRRNFIDIPRLMRMAFRLMSWGPNTA